MNEIEKLSENHILELNLFFSVRLQYHQGQKSFMLKQFEERKKTNLPPTCYKFRKVRIFFSTFVTIQIRKFLAEHSTSVLNVMRKIIWDFYISGKGIKGWYKKDLSWSIRLRRGRGLGVQHSLLLTLNVRRDFVL